MNEFCSNIGEFEKSVNLDNKSSKDLIKEIIDEAIKKKDRSVTIFISGESSSISVYPYEEKYPTWVAEKNWGVYESQFRCPKCSSISNFMTPYCPNCGEQLSKYNEEK